MVAEAEVALHLHKQHAGQMLLTREKARFNVVVCGRRWGKTRDAIDRATDTLLDGKPVGWFNPNYPNLAETWRVVADKLEPITARRSEQEHRIECVTGGILECWSLDAPDTARGRAYARVIGDELAMARQLEMAWQNVIRPTLTDYEGDAWLYSTPRGAGFFHSLYQRGQDPAFPEWRSWRFPTTDNPHIPAQEVAAAQRELPERVFAQEYLAEFVTDANNPYDPFWWMATQEHEARRFDPKEPSQWIGSAGRFISWDTALKDTETADFSACVVGELTDDWRLFIREVWRDRVTFPALLRKIEQMARKYGQDEHIVSGARENKLKAIVIEDKVSGVSALQTMREASDPWLAALLKPFEPKTGKIQRAGQAAEWCEKGCVWFPHPSEDAPWLFDFERELYDFPDGPHKDMADAFAQLVLYLEVHGFMKAGWQARRANAETLAAQEREYAQ
jgi:predicted phage terminase large subunit-like protein